MNDIDELVRAFRADLPEPQMPPPAETARRAAAEYERTRPARRARRIGRGLAVGAGAVGAAALATVLVVLLVDQRGTTGGTGAARVAWGVTSTISITPDAPAVSTDEAVEGLRRGLLMRARTDDIAGMRITPAGTKSLAVSIPGVDDRLSAERVASLISVDAFHMPSATIATARDVRGLTSAAAALRGQITKYAVEASRGLRTVRRTRAEAERLLVLKRWRGGSVLPLPDGVLLMFTFSSTDGRPRVVLMRDEPVASARQLASGRLVGGGLDLTPQPESADAVHAAFTRLIAGGARPTLTVVHRDKNGLWTTDVATGTGVRWIGGHLRAAHASQFTAWFGPVPRAIVAGRVRVGATTRFGTAPAPVGDHVSTLPPPLDADPVTYRSSPMSTAAEVERATIVRVADTEALASAPTWTLYGGLTADGREATWITGPGLPRAVPLSCTPGPGAPVLRVCGGIDGHGVGDFLLVGRVRAPVATVETRDASGRTLRSTIRNGYFMLPSTSLSSGVIGRDAAGKVIATVENQQLILPEYLAP